jgi:hypothetical protein
MSRVIEATCKDCLQDVSLTVDAATHDRYLMREGLVQNMFSDLTPADRDIIISANPPYNRTSGMSYYLCVECWERTMQEAGEDYSEATGR